MGETKKRCFERGSDKRDLYEKAGRQLGRAIRDYDNARRLAKEGKPTAAAVYRESGGKHVARAKRFARRAMSS